MGSGHGWHTLWALLCLCCPSLALGTQPSIGKALATWVSGLMISLQAAPRGSGLVWRLASLMRPTVGWSCSPRQPTHDGRDAERLGILGP